MPRYLKPVALITFICIISYLSYLAGTYRNYKSIEYIFSKTLNEVELAETRHDEGIVQALADGNKETIFILIQHRYFLRVLRLLEQLEGKQIQEHQDVVLAHIAKAQKLHKRLSYRFPTEKENNEWELLSSSLQAPN
jgi:hypothetical protein